MLILHPYVGERAAPRPLYSYEVERQRCERALASVLRRRRQVRRVRLFRRVLALLAPGKRVQRAHTAVCT